jgi:hypothetical protein
LSQRLTPFSESDTVDMPLRSTQFGRNPSPQSAEHDLARMIANLRDAVGATGHSAPLLPTRLRSAITHPADPISRTESAPIVSDEGLASA